MHLRRSLAVFLLLGVWADAVCGIARYSLLSPRSAGCIDTAASRPTATDAIFRGRAVDERRAHVKKTLEWHLP